MVIEHMRINVTMQALGWILCDANCDLMVITIDVRHKLSHYMNVLKLLQVIMETGEGCWSIVFQEIR